MYCEIKKHKIEPKSQTKIHSRFDIWENKIYMINLKSAMVLICFGFLVNIGIAQDHSDIKQTDVSDYTNKHLVEASINEGYLESRI